MTTTIGNSSSVELIEEHYKKLLKEKDDRIRELEEQNETLHKQLIRFMENENERFCVQQVQKPLSFQSLFMGEENADLWWNVVAFLNGIDVINLARSHSELLAFYMKYRLYIWRNLVANEFHMDRLKYNDADNSEDEWIYWKTLYMKRYDFLYREGWKSSQLDQQCIQHDSLSILFIEYNPIVATRFLPKYVPILDLLETPGTPPDGDMQNSTTAFLSSVFKKKKVATKFDMLTSDEKKMRDILVNDKHYALVSTLHSPIFHLFNLNYAKIERSFRGHQGTIHDIDPMCTDPYWIGRGHMGIGSGTLLNKTSSTSFNNRAISASSDETLKIWNLMTGKCLTTLKSGHNGSVYSVRCTNDQIKAVSCGHDGRIALWDCTTGTLIHKEQTHTSVCYSVRIDPYFQSTAVSCGRDGAVNVYDMRDNARLVDKFEHFDANKSYSPVYCVDICNQYIVSGTKTGEVTVWDLRHSNRPLQVLSHTGSINRVHLDEVKCAVSLNPSEIRVYEINHQYKEDDLHVLDCISRQNVPQLSDYSLITGSSVSFDTHLALTGDERGNLYLLSSRKKKKTRGKKSNRADT